MRTGAVGLEEEEGVLEDGLVVVGLRAQPPDDGDDAGGGEGDDQLGRLAHLLQAVLLEGRVLRRGGGGGGRSAAPRERNR